jgi:hypothetical protein
VGNACFEEDEGDGGDARARGLERAEAPLVVAVEAAVYVALLKAFRNTRATHLIHSMSMRCCSATLFSLFTFRCSAVKMLRFSMRYSPPSRLTASRPSFAMPFASVAASVPVLGGMVKYSSSSRSTMIACLDKSGFCAGAGLKPSAALLGEPDGEDGASRRCCWKANRPGVVAVP